MSLRDFVELPDVAARLAPFRGSPQKANAKLLVPSRMNPSLTGTAFDYYLRFELQRRARHAKDREWVAEGAPFLLSFRTINPDIEADINEEIAASERSAKAKAVCRSARKALAAHLKDPEPSQEGKEALAAWAVKLAKLDGVSRGHGLDPTFEEAAPEMVDDLVAMLDVVPFDQLLHPETMLLNPVFGNASRLVGGADADLVTGDTLVDFKATASCEVYGNHIDQLFGYFLLARRAGFPTINKVALYFARYGRLRPRETADWVNHSAFADTEKWFFERAEQVYPQPKPLATTPKPKARKQKKK